MLTDFLLKHHQSNCEEYEQALKHILEQLLDAIDQGASCIQLKQIPDQSTHQNWHQWLRCGEQNSIIAGPDGFSPLVLENDRLYLRRYFQHEINVARSLIQYANQPATPLPKHLTSLINSLFPEEQSFEQKQAAKQALSQNLTIISGGPGTGKTTTVVKILFLLALMGKTSGSNDTLLLAPTGKAADRLSQSIQVGIQHLIDEMPEDAIILSSLPREASTIHRALGYRPESVEFRHNKSNPLSAKLVIVDETSMVDLPLMARLLEAIPPTCQIIFLGDQHQLASVQVGSVLADLIESADAPASILAPCFAKLTQTFRTTGAIKHCCDQIREGNSSIAWDIASNKGLSNSQATGAITVKSLPNTPSLELEPFILKHWLPALLDTELTPQQKLTAIDKFRILTPSHHGPYGIQSINQAVNRVLQQHGFNIDNPWFIGRSIIVTSNNYPANVFNGDTGMILPHPDETTNPDQTPTPYIHFPSSENKNRYVSPSRLPNVETAWSLTIHRTQGSEYEHVLLILPPPVSENQPQNFITRELLYTGLSRAKSSATIWVQEEHFKSITEKRILRPSGLSGRFFK